MKKQFNAIHAGEVLQEEFMKPLGISAYRLAKEIHVSATRIGEITAGKRAITAETALLLSRFFGTTPEFWMNLQAQYDLEITKERLSDKIRSVHHRTKQTNLMPERKRLFVDHEFRVN